MSDISIYETNSGSIEVRLERETVWLSQEQMAALFGSGTLGLTKHLSNVFTRGELEEGSNVQNMHIAGGKTGQIFNLDVIISVGYRVKSPQGDPFPPMGHPHSARAPHPRVYPQSPAVRSQCPRVGSGPATGAKSRAQP
jgi:hypothetical protein